MLLHIILISVNQDKKRPTVTAGFVILSTTIKLKHNGQNQEVHDDLKSKHCYCIEYRISARNIIIDTTGKRSESNEKRLLL